MSGELKRLDALTKNLDTVLPMQDYRLQHILVFVLANKPFRDCQALYTRVVVEQFFYFPPIEGSPE